MRIAIDARALLPNTTGIGTYTRSIGAALAGCPDVSIGMFSPRRLPDGRGQGPWTVHEDSHSFGMLWAQTTLSARARRWGADAILSALTIGPTVAADPPFVSVVHDLTAWTHPQWHAPRTVVGFVPLWERTVERASRFLCVSETTARELVERYPETRARVRVARNGLDPGFSPAAQPAGAEVERTRRQHAGGEPFVLYLGTLEPRKNVESLILACERLWSKRRSRPDLVLAGGVGWNSAALFRRIARSPYRDKIHLVGYASRDMAADLYRAAEAFVYPSLAEGFGLPPLEAMACGTPVVVSTAEALVEVCGDAALYAPPRDIAELERQIERALEDPETRQRLRAAGPVRAARFTWEAAARSTLAALEEAAREGAR
ncbi:MAG: glycosyltransferase family 4 protein [Acidobacteriota bacterium]|nr:glycosyltransferase family 4 protein [Acidobacteriota bacterium]